MGHQQLHIAVVTLKYCLAHVQGNVDVTALRELIQKLINYISQPIYVYI